MNDVSSLPMGTDQYDVFSRIYNEYYIKLYKYTLFRVADQYVAEDLVSEIFVKVLDKYNTYNPTKGKFSTWVFAIANNTIINYYKKFNRNKVVDWEQVDSQYRLEDLIIEQELKEILLKAILGLDERQRSIIALKFGANMKNREIAQMLNLTESNVGTILYRSLKHLRDNLKKQGVIFE
ncbi:MAG: sigma-70 family RNA polymerase sigma factor [Methanocorpusculum sp.]|nr:sigma-70 family RNA polymerase sigma factor [Methanocorpusculum sp.]